MGCFKQRTVARFGACERPAWSLCLGYLVLVAAMLVAPLAAAVPSTPGTALGPRIPVSQNAPGSQRVVAAVGDAAGDFAVADFDYVRSVVTIHAFNSSAVPTHSTTIQVNTSDGRNIDAAMDASGQLVVVWCGADAPSQVNSVYGQRYDADLQPLGSRFQISKESYCGAAVAADAVGDFIVSWIGDAGVMHRSYNSAGQPVGASSSIAIPKGQALTSVDVAMAADGRSVLIYSERGGDASSALQIDLLGQRFDRDGLPAGPGFAIDTQGDNPRGDITVGMAGNGTFVVAWSRNDSSMVVQRYTAQGVRRGRRINLQSVHYDFANFPDIAMDATGDFAVVWEAVRNLNGQLFDSHGTPLGDRIVLSADTGDDYVDRTYVTLDADGDFTAVYTLDGGGNQPDVFARHYVGPEPVDVALTLSSNPSTAARGATVDYRAFITNNHDPVAPISSEVAGSSIINDAIGQAAPLDLVFGLPSQVSLETSHVTSSQRGRVFCRRNDKGNVPAGATVFDCLLPQPLAAGQSVSLDLPVTEPATDSRITIAAQATSAQYDPNETTSGSGNNFDTVSTTIGQGASNGGDSSGGSDGGGGGCTMGAPNSPLDPVFLLLLGLSLGVIVVRRKSH